MDVKLTCITIYRRLRILLYIPHLTHLRLAAQAHSAIARAVTQILHIYAELIAIKQLNPSWPQIQRLVVCGQLLILCYESGELRGYEAQTLFGMVVDMLDKHAPTWPVCEGLAEGFQKAARAFGGSQVFSTCGREWYTNPILQTFKWSVSRCRGWSSQAEEACL